MVAKANTHGADVVIFDLEDSVAPAEKSTARRTISDALRMLDFGSSLRAVRMNAPGSPWAHGDLIELMEHAGDLIDVVVVPKVTSPRDVWYVDTLLTELEGKLRLQRRVGLELLIEEAEGLGRVEEIAGCCDRTEALVLGFGDMAASLGMRLDDLSGEGDTVDYPGDIWHAPRSRLVAAARAHGLDPIEGPFLNFANPERLRRDARLAAAMGCVGKWAIHPNQVSAVQAVFSPTGSEVARARAAIDAMRASEAAGAGAAAHNGAMLDAATTRMFQQTVDRAEAITARTSAESGTRPR